MYYGAPFAEFEVVDLLRAAKESTTAKLKLYSENHSCKAFTDAVRWELMLYWSDLVIK